MVGLTREARVPVEGEGDFVAGVAGNARGVAREGTELGIGRGEGAARGVVRETKGAEVAREATGATPA